MSFIDEFQQMSFDELREDIIRMLQQAYTDGHISVDTLEHRLSNASSAETKEKLMVLVSDIPSSAELGAGRRKERSWHTNKRVADNHEFLTAVMGSSERSGNWQPARRISAFALMGSIVIDLRNAEFPAEGIMVNCVVIMGSVELILPPGIHCSISGLPLMASFENKTDVGDRNAPKVQVKGFALMGSVEAKQHRSSKKDKGNP